MINQSLFIRELGGRLLQPHPQTAKFSAARGLSKNLFGRVAHHPAGGFVMCHPNRFTGNRQQSADDPTPYCSSRCIICVEFHCRRRRLERDSILAGIPRCSKTPSGDRFTRLQSRKKLSRPARQLRIPPTHRQWKTTPWGPTSISSSTAAPHRSAEIWPILQPGSLKIQRLCGAMEPFQVCSPLLLHLTSLFIPYTHGQWKNSLGGNIHLILHTPRHSAE